MNEFYTNALEQMLSDNPSVDDEGVSFYSGDHAYRDATVLAAEQAVAAAQLSEGYSADAETSALAAATEALNAASSATDAATAATNAANSAGTAATEATNSATSAAAAAQSATDAQTIVDGIQPALDAKVDEAPTDSTYYARFNATWQAITLLGEAPQDGEYYTRHNGGWTTFPRPIGALEARYAFDTGTTPTGLAAGQYRFNSATLGSVSEVYVHTTDLDGRDRSFIAPYLTPGVHAFTQTQEEATGIATTVSGQATVANSIITVPVNTPTGAVPSASTTAYIAIDKGLDDAIWDTSAYLRSNGSWVLGVTKSDIQTATADSVGSERIHLSKSVSATEEFNTANDGDLVAVGWDQQDSIDTSIYTHDTVTNNSRITVSEAGLYRVHAALAASNGTDNRIALAVHGRVNGATSIVRSIGRAYSRGSTTGNIFPNDVTAVWDTEITLAAGDYLEIVGMVELSHAQIGSVAPITAQCELIITRVHSKFDDYQTRIAAL